MREKLEGLTGLMGQGRVAIHRYGDDTIDGEVSFPLKRGESAADLITRIRDAYQDTKRLESEFWLQVGTRYTIKEDEEVYRRYKGMNEIGTRFTRMRRSDVPVFGAIRDFSVPGAEKKYRRKADSVYVRIHWNPSNAKPKR